jgi:hypothetical protein
MAPPYLEASPSLVPLAGDRERHPQLAQKIRQVGSADLGSVNVGVLTHMASTEQIVMLAQLHAEGLEQSCHTYIRPGIQTIHL